jgi:type I restriction enzyme S subunit
MFFSYLSGSHIGKRYYLSCAKQTTNLASINSSQLKLFPVLLPPIKEQLKICEVMGSLDFRIALSEEKLTRLNDSKKALMQDLLTGKVRVKVDEPEKESAVA